MSWYHVVLHIMKVLNNFQPSSVMFFEDVKKSEVESRPSRPFQFSTSVEPTAQKPCPSVRQQILSNRSKDFLDFWQEVRHWHSKKTDTARFSVKNRVAPYWATTSLKSWFLTILTMLRCFRFFEILNLDFLRHFWRLVKFLGQTTFGNMVFYTFRRPSICEISHFWPSFHSCSLGLNWRCT